ncbi:MAG TPA: biopolymer transporter ExbD [Kofleriaceae bacterium]|jgi:biopolymer transport protein ExbD|nr:biopolymer transporter ExbD [Kofleriaceae bacterium]
MPVHVAGPRLYKSIKFQHLAKGGASSKKNMNIHLNLTPFVDMMTILVTFLLMVFSATGQILQAQKGLELPKADSKDVLQTAPVIVITNHEITYQGQLIATVDSVLHDDSPTLRIDALYERLQEAANHIADDVRIGKLSQNAKKSCDDMKNGLRPPPGAELCPLGLAIVQGDQTTDARLINKIVKTAKDAGFDNLLFAIKNK